MTFNLVGTGGNCVGCEWISAEGYITDGTASRFRSFMEDRGARVCADVVLNSLGGDLFEGVELGKTLREYDCRTRVGHTVPDRFQNHEIINQGVCLSACAYAFLGGVRRSIEAGNVYGVHQHYDPVIIGATSKKQFDAEDMTFNQFITGSLVSYVMRKEASPMLVALASATAPEEMYYLSRYELEKIRVVTDLTPENASWLLEPIDDGLVAQVSQEQDDSGIIQRARLLCMKGHSDVPLLEITVPVGQSATDIPTGHIGEKQSLILKASREHRTSEYYSDIISNSDEKYMVIRVRLTRQMLEDIDRSDKLIWKRPSASYIMQHMHGWFSLNRSAAMSRYAFKHCL